MIVKKLRADGIVTNKAKVSRIVNGIGKKRQSEAKGETYKVNRPRPVRTKPLVSKVKRLATVENPPSQRKMARMCGTTLKIVNNIIHEDLDLITRRKTKVHKLNEYHMKNRKTNARKLYEKHLAGTKWQYVVTLDEAWMYLTYTNGTRKICYVKRGKNMPEEWVRECSESFPKGFLVVGAISGRGPLPLIRVPVNVKVNADYYIEYVLKPIINELKIMYPGELHKVFLHHDKASSHTAKKTMAFLNDTKAELGLNFIANSDIPVKSPDISPLDFYGFGFLKQRLFNRRPKTVAGLWNVLKDVWSQITIEKVTEVFSAWKLRCRVVVKMEGKHIEQSKQIHSRKRSL